MDLPKRTSSHVIEKKALNVFNNQLPSEWIIREITERDYGIDQYIEIVSNEGRVTGQLVGIQVKGSENITFQNDTAKYSGIKKSTYNYWINLSFPVFIIYVDLSNLNSYWSCINEDFRKKHDYSSQKTVTINFIRTNNFKNVGIKLFQLAYQRERRWEDIKEAVFSSLMSFNTLGPLFLYCKRQPEDKFTSSTIQFLLNRHYEIFCILNRYLIRIKDNPLPIKLSEWYEKHIQDLRNDQNISSTTFRYKLIMEFLRYFIPDYWSIVKNVYKLVTITELAYWEKSNPYLLLHLKDKPPTFIMDDWFSRYYFDEYENETNDLLKCFFEDPKIF